MRITVGPEAVKIAIVANLVFADEVVGVLRENRDAIVPSEHAAVRKALEDFFRKGMVVHLDGVEVAPRFEDFAVEGPEDDRLMPLFPRFGLLAMTKLRLVLSYSAKSVPQSLKVLWSAFPPNLAISDREDAPPIEINGLALAAGREQALTFRIDEPEFRWTRDEAAGEALFALVPKPTMPVRWNLPVATLALVALSLLVVLFVRPKRRAWGLGLAGVVLAALSWPFARYEVASPLASEPLPTAREGRAIFEALHANVYRAFDYGTEGEVYDALARSVHGRMLEELYDSIYSGLVMREEGGAVSRVKRVELLEADVADAVVVDESASFDVDARWKVYGEVFHWGHGHNQTNEYVAQYRVARVDDSWRIVGHVPKSSQVLEKNQALGR